MTKNLVIVESPAKAKTLQKFLGSEYVIKASMGHIRDLPEKGDTLSAAQKKLPYIKVGIDVENNFEPVYVIKSDKKKVVSDLKNEIGTDTIVWIATDEDREGEAIGWHLVQALGIKKNPIKRIVFHEITKSAILDALQHPREIDENLVNAQQARRILDRLVGFELSPLLWQKIRYGLSAGRVQSVATRIVVDREREINAFIAEEFWKIKAHFIDPTLEADLIRIDGQKLDNKKLKVSSEAESKTILADLTGASYVVSGIQKKEAISSPPAPFITSTLQQEASRKLSFSVKQTMSIAQQLYEGNFSIPNVEGGLITYMRTDSTNLAQVALTAAREVIIEDFGAGFALDAPRVYKTKSKGAQEAHEAIRPTDMRVRPDDVKNYLDPRMYKLYNIIWQRTMACQMKEAILENTVVEIDAHAVKPTVELLKKDEMQGVEKRAQEAYESIRREASADGDDADRVFHKFPRKYTFGAEGKVIKFPGYMKVYTEGTDNPEEALASKERILPDMHENQQLHFSKLTTEQCFTKPPARYTEASLVKKLEAEGIGRPSTYAPTISTIENRGYIEKIERKLHATDLAMVVTDFLVKHFADVVDYKFTAKVEEDLDQIADGEKKWVPTLQEFYKKFHGQIEQKSEEVKKEDVMKERNLGKDPETGLPILVLRGRFGPFVQLGEKKEGDDEKPRRASLPKNILFETVKLEEALKFLSLPRSIGAYQGEEVIVNSGPYGPYIKVGKTNYSLPETVDPYTVNLDQIADVIAAAIELRKQQKEPLARLGIDPISKKEILIKIGRFGQYVTDGTTNVSIKKDTEIGEITHEVAAEMLEKKRHAPKRAWGKKSRGKRSGA
jgi:DNA topoisomerase-1